MATSRAIPGVGKVLVICTYRAITRVGNSSYHYTDAIVIEVEASAQILDAFKLEMNRRVMLPNQYRIGPIPSFFELIRYRPQNGLKRFDFRKPGTKGGPRSCATLKALPTL